jgi:hypothetical protein
MGLSVGAESRTGRTNACTVSDIRRFGESYQPQWDLGQRVRVNVPRSDLLVTIKLTHYPPAGFLEGSCAGPLQAHAPRTDRSGCGQGAPLATAGLSLFDAP